MDTIELIYNSEIDVDLFRDQFDNIIMTEVRDRHFERVLVFKDQNSKHIVTIKIKAHYNIRISNLIIFNLQGFESICDINLILLRGGIPLDELYIKRLDHSLDLYIPIQKVYESLKPKKKGNQRSIKIDESYKQGDLTGYYIGSLASEEFYCIYDKSYQESLKKRFKRIKDIKSGEKTRVELRQHGKKIKYDRFVDLKNYISDPPFKDLIWCEVDPRQVKSIKDLNFLKELKQKGILQTYKSFNKHSNANRDMAHFLGQIDISEKFNNAYSDNLKAFFGVN